MPSEKRKHEGDGEPGAKRPRKSRWAQDTPKEDTKVVTPELLTHVANLKAAAQQEALRKSALSVAAGFEDPTAKELSLRAAAIQQKIATKMAAVQNKVPNQMGSIFEPDTDGPVTSLKINERLKREATVGKIRKDAKEDAGDDLAFFDPNLGSDKPGRRRKQTFRFLKEGAVIRQANKMRTEAHLHAIGAEDPALAAKKAKESMKGPVGNANMIPLGERNLGVKQDPIPDVEWWDVYVLEGGADYDVGKGEYEYSYEFHDITNIKMSRITNLIEHPAQAKPVVVEPAVKPLPIMLTKAERKKRRRQDRMAAQKEKQLKIRLGLEKAPEPKIKMSNMMRVLGMTAVVDPSATEKMVREQVNARAKEHERRNNERKLTKEQKSEKLARKLKEDPAITTVLVFRIDKLNHRKWLYKVDINAKQYNLTGCCIVKDGLNIVVVEGGPKGTKKYKKLMLDRIDWNDTVGLLDADEEEEEDYGRNQTENKCLLVWEGHVRRPAFKDFRFEKSGDESISRLFLKRANVEHYYDLAKNYIEPEV